jgi:hypothetical protein
VHSLPKTLGRLYLVIGVESFTFAVGLSVPVDTSVASVVCAVGALLLLLLLLLLLELFGKEETKKGECNG